MPRLTREQLKEITGRGGYTVASGLHDAKPQHDAGQEPLASPQIEAVRNASIIVRITRVATKKLDKDNLYGGVKFLCDGLRYKKLIPEDDPDSIDLIVTQRLVHHRKECGTEIHIIYL